MEVFNQVFTLRRGNWKILSNNLPKKSILVAMSGVVIDSFIYWRAFDDDIQIKRNLIISFDMTTEELRMIDLPDNLARASLSISKIWDSIAVIDYIEFPEEHACVVWMMDHGVPGSFTKLFAIDSPYSYIGILAFTNSGQPIMEKLGDETDPITLVAYEPDSKIFKDIGIYGTFDSFLVGLYMETLLLFDQSDCSVYSNIN